MQGGSSTTALQPWEVPFDSIKIQKVLGAGSFGKFSGCDAFVLAFWGEGYIPMDSIGAVAIASLPHADLAAKAEIQLLLPRA